MRSRVTSCRQHTGQPGGAAVYAFMAVDFDRRGRHPVLGSFDIRNDARTQLHAQRRDELALVLMVEL